MAIDAGTCGRILKAGGLFANIDPGQLPQLLEALRCRHMRYEAGEVIEASAKPVTDMGYVLSGTATMSFTNAEGQEVILRVMHPGEDFLGEMAYAGGHSNPFLIRAEKPCEALFLDITPIRVGQDLPCGRQLAMNLTAGFARKSISVYMRAYMYSQKRIRSRVMLYLMTLPHPDGTVALPLNRTEMAAYLGVDRTALARELTRMQAEGLIELDHQQIRLLDRGFFPMDD